MLRIEKWLSTDLLLVISGTSNLCRRAPVASEIFGPTYGTLDLEFPDEIERDESLDSSLSNALAAFQRAVRGEHC